jgi:hypothetical protein
MANFLISITDPVTTEAAVTDINDILTVTDYSNYGESVPEVGHNKSDFNAYRRLKITLPTGVEYLFSSRYPTEGDVTLPVPSTETLPIATAYSYPSGDGRYILTLYALPTWGSGYAYVYSSGNPVYIWHTATAKVYKLLQNSTNNVPGSAPTYWQETTDVETLSSKYRLVQNVTLVSDMKECMARRVYDVNCINNIAGVREELLLRDPEFMDAIKLFLGIRAIPILMRVSAWTEIETIVNNSRLIKAKYE